MKQPGAEEVVCLEFGAAKYERTLGAERMDASGDLEPADRERHVQRSEGSGGKLWRKELPEFRDVRIGRSKGEFAGGAHGQRAFCPKLLPHGHTVVAVDPGFEQLFLKPGFAELFQVERLALLDFLRLIGQEEFHPALEKGPGWVAKKAEQLVEREASKFRLRFAQWPDKERRADDAG